MWAKNPLFHNMRSETGVKLTAGLAVITDHYPRFLLSFIGCFKSTKQLVHSFHKNNMTSAETIRPFVISRFRRVVDEICALLGPYATCGSKSVPTFQDNLLVPSSEIKK
jgi:hypothetical protein